MNAFLSDVKKECFAKQESWEIGEEDTQNEGQENLLMIDIIAHEY